MGSRGPPGQSPHRCLKKSCHRETPSVGAEGVRINSPVSRQEPVMFSRLIPYVLVTRATSTTAPAHPSMAGVFVLVTLILLIGAYLAVKHLRVTLAVAIVCPILLITYCATKILVAVGRT